MSDEKVPTELHLADVGGVEMCHSGIAGKRRYVAVSVQGERHRVSGQPRQDALAVANYESYSAYAVCDGVGRAALSQHGSRVAANAAVLDRNLHRRVRDAARSDSYASASEIVSAIAAEATKLGSPPAELATTLVLALVEAGHSPGSACVSFAQVGDSTAWLAAPKALEKVSPSDSHPAHSSDRPRRPMPILETLRCWQVTLEAPAVVVLISDGVESLLAEDTKFHKKLSECLASSATDARQLRRALMEHSPINGDDRSVLAFAVGETR